MRAREEDKSCGGPQGCHFFRSSNGFILAYTSRYILVDCLASNSHVDSIMRRLLESEIHICL